MATKISTRYAPQDTESKWYDHWMKENYFHSEPDEREAFTIVIPPPNVTGVLHMGHMLNNTIQDILIRKARLDGKNACWVPGTDHASIATEAKVVRMLREQGIKKSDLTRDQFLEHAWAWTDKYGGIILDQLKRLGESCDWERTSFTMDETRYPMIIKVFVDLYKKGKLYRDYRMVNWDPQAKTVLSNEEVLYSEENRKLYHIRYKVEGTEDEWVTIATTRPETILADAAIAVHPKDERYTHLKGKKVLIPLIDRPIPIIEDDYVDREFGTGALKVTPAHDTNDYEIGKRHELEVIEILNEDATLNEKAILYIGQDRFKARKSINVDLEEQGYLVNVEDYSSNVGRSERTNAIIEPRLSMQWFVDMQQLVDPALKSVMEDTVEFFPKHFKNTYNHWMSNIRDWCISRQLWWGHRIPAWYYGEEIFVAETAEEALAEARERLGNPALDLNDLQQEDDVLDTWFSSWLWPISVFDGFERPEVLDYYYPTNVLVTGWDIIFLWVARMIMAGYEWKEEKPFEHVYFTGMVRDKQRRKMSKSLGNSPDALELINTFGADGVRFGMLSSSPAGGDLLFDEKLCEQGRNFCNKIWNALRLVDGWEIKDDIQDPERIKGNQMAIDWFEERFNQVLEAVDKNFKDYSLSEGLKTLYTFVWGDFCSWYLEMIKPPYGEALDRATYEQTIEFFSRLMTLLHPFMPFLTEEIWHLLKERQAGEDCIVSSWPTAQPYDASTLEVFELAMEITSKVRDLRNQHGISPKEALPLSLQQSAKSGQLEPNGGIVYLIKKLANLSSFEWIDSEPEGATSFMAKTEKLFTFIEKEIDVETEREKLLGELKKAQGFLIGVEKKLSNERFVSNAPEAVVAKEKKKLEDGKARIKNIEESLARLEA
ncbi:MAG: valine--tRNA ligase [Bacteroidota bacterium]